MGSWLRIVELGVIGSYSTVKPKLPHEFGHILLKAYSLGPSVTAVVAEFGLSSQVSYDLTSLLKRRHNPYIENENGQILALDSDHALERAVEKFRDDLEDRAQIWFRSNLPGLFAEGGSKGKGIHMPLIDFILTRKADPQSESREDVLRLLNLDTLETWRSSSVPELLLTVRHGPRTRQKSRRYTISGNIDRVLSSSAITSRNSPSVGSAAWYVGEYLAPAIACRIAIAALLDKQLEDVGYLRDWAEAGMRRHSRKSSSAMRDIATTVVADSTIALTDLRRFAESDRTYFYELDTFRAYGRARVDLANIGCEDYFSWLRDELANGITQFREQHDNVKELLELSASFNTELHASRAQFLATAIATLSLFIALVALVVSATNESLVIEWFHSR